MASLDNLSFAGQVEFEYLKLISFTSQVVDLNDYLIEFNLYEDIFSNFLHGDIMVSDSRNLLSKLPIVGEEYLLVKFTTPTLQRTFEKYFRIYSVTDQLTVRDKSTQTYRLHFCSVEAIVDANVPIYKSFSGKASDIASEIFNTFLKNPRTLKIEEKSIKPDETTATPLYFTETANNLKFISPGWSPAKCINWICSKSIPSEGLACDYLFWESTQGFVFSNIESLYKAAHKESKYAGEYFYIPVGTKDSDASIDKMFLAENFEVVRYTDNIDNYTNGFYGSKLISLNLTTKEYKSYDFNYLNNYSKFTHSNGDSVLPPFPLSGISSPAATSFVYPSTKNLFSGVPNNFTDRMPDIHGNRISKLNELKNFKINITVPGRTDVFVGGLIKFNYPDITVKNEAAEQGNDMLFSGLYLITAIRHKINYKTHMMVMELVKDSVPLYGGGEVVW